MSPGELRKMHATRLGRLRSALSLSQEEMGGLLGVTREWVGKLERGQEDFSEFLLLKMEQVSSPPRDAESPQAEEATSHAKSERPEFDAKLHRPDRRNVADAPADLRDGIMDLVTRVVRAAGDDPSRLGWITEQMRMHLSIPHHWRKVVAGSTLTADHVKALEILAAEKVQRSSRNTQEGAG